MFSILEIAILALVLTPGSSDFMCRERDGGDVLCSNGLTARMIDHDMVRFSNFVQVQRSEDGKYIFSNGIHATRSAAGGVWFSTGLTVRRRSYNTFDFSNRMTCQSILPETAACSRQP